MAYIDIPIQVMLGITLDYVGARHLRGRLEAEPRLKPFIADFEDLARAFRAHLGPDVGKAERDGLRAERDGFIETHDRLVRQISHLLLGAQASGNSELVAQAETAEALVLPEGRAVLLSGHLGRVASAWALPQPSVEEEVLLRSLVGPTGHLLSLHRARLAAISAAARVMQDLRRLDERRSAPKDSAWATRRRWARTMRLFQSTVEHVGLDPETQAALLTHVEQAAQGGGLSKAQTSSIEDAPLPGAPEQGPPAGGPAGRELHAGPPGAALPIAPLPAGGAPREARQGGGQGIRGDHPSGSPGDVVGQQMVAPDPQPKPVAAPRGRSEPYQATSALLAMGVDEERPLRRGVEQDIPRLNRRDTTHSSSAPPEGFIDHPVRYLGNKQDPFVLGRCLCAAPMCRHRGLRHPVLSRYVRSEQSD